MLLQKNFNIFGKMPFNLEDLIVLKTFTYPHELAIVRGKLESEGIECVVQDELTVQAYPLYSNAVGGIKLKVKAADYERATEILKEAGYSADDDYPAPPITKILDEAGEKIAKFDWWKMVLTLAVLVLIVAGAYYFLVRK
jgi:hypothetical protein